MTLSKAFAICTMGAAVCSCYNPAEAQSGCGPTEAVEKNLKELYNETAMLEADHESGAVIQFFASPDMKTGTFIIKRPDGLSCVAIDFTDIRPASKSKPLAPTKEI